MDGPSAARTIQHIHFVLCRCLRSVITWRFDKLVRMWQSSRLVKNCSRWSSWQLHANVQSARRLAIYHLRVPNWKLRFR